MTDDRTPHRDQPVPSLTEPSPDGDTPATTPPEGPGRALVPTGSREIERHPHQVRQAAGGAALAAGRAARQLAVAAGTALTSEQSKAAARRTGHVTGELLVGTARVTGTALVGAARGINWTARRFLPIDQPLLRDPIFRTFWLSRLLVQMAQGAMLYALLIVVVDLTSSSFYTALFVNCSILPAIIFGIPGGIVSDSLPRRPTMVALNLARFVLITAALLVDLSLAGVFALTIGLWVIHQFYSPIESTVVASLVPPSRFSNAQALHNLALTIAQALGLVLAAPLILRFFDISVLFALCAALFLAAAGFASQLPRLDDQIQAEPDPAPAATNVVDGDAGVTHRPARRSTDRQPGSLQTTAAWFLNGWKMVTRDRIALGAVMDDMLVGFGLTSLIVIMPLYLEAVLNTAQENTTFVFAPAALGLIIGLRAAPALNAVVENRYIATAGLVLFATSVLAFGFVREVANIINGPLRLPLDQLSDAVGIGQYVLVVMAFSIPAGFASAIVGVAARSVLLSRIRPNARGQVIASQNLFQSLVTLLPTFAVGIFADLFGIRIMAVMIGMTLLLGAAVAHISFTTRPREVVEPGD
ncbi:MAG TPA: MFS transporter [Thermomicrobiales bacterium]|nr:MFS transporter [Thermomicrobiales bacterium]